MLTEKQPLEVLHRTACNVIEKEAPTQVLL